MENRADEVPVADSISNRRCVLVSVPFSLRRRHPLSSHVMHRRLQGCGLSFLTVNVRQPTFLVDQATSAMAESTSALQRHHDLAELPVGFEVAMHFHNFVELKDA